MTTGIDALPDRCPRCGAAFACGAQGPQACACASVALSTELRRQLAQRFHGCLCRPCLLELVEGAPLEREAARP